MQPHAWISGPVVATAVLAILGFQFAFFASEGGLFLAAGGAFWAGAGAAAMIDARRAGRNAIIVGVWIIVTTSSFVAWAQWQSNIASQRDPINASQGGPNVYPSAGTVLPPPPPRPQ